MKQIVLKAVSIGQPDATLLVNGKLRVLVMAHRPIGDNGVHRGLLAIHAGSNSLSAWHHLSTKAAAALEEIGYQKGHSDWLRGAIIGLADIVDVVPVERSSSRKDSTVLDRELIRRRRASRAFAQRWTWIFANARRLIRPVPYPGSSGLWSIPA